MSIDYEVVRQRIARIHLNRPKSRNPISPDDSRDMLKHLKTAQADPAARGVVFPGEAEHFSPRADLPAYDQLIHSV